MKDLSIEEISDRIVDSILNEHIFSRENLKKCIKPVLSIWVKKTQSPTTAEAFGNALKNEIDKHKESKIAYQKKCKEKYVKSLNKLSKERNYYRNELIKLYGFEGIKTIDKLMID